MKKLLNELVPEEETGFVSFDRYWGYIEADSSLRTNDNVRLVMNKIQTLKNCIQNTVRRQYKPIANQFVNALAVYRLTTDDLKTPIGLTSEALRDELFVSHPMLLEMGEDAEFLLLQIETALNEVRKAASFQFLSQNEANGQYYIDVDKAMAVDDLIKDRGESLNGNQLDRYYFQVLKQATEVTNQKEYVDGYKIWLHEIPWKSHMVKREGYLFFGAPNERSTAQPERDFYIYMLQPFEEPKFKDEEKEDEIFFRLVKKDDNFVTCFVYMVEQVKCIMIQLQIAIYINPRWMKISKNWFNGYVITSWMLMKLSIVEVNHKRYVNMEYLANQKR